MKQVWTYDLARAASQDAANRRMRKAGRKAWSRGDYNHAIDEFNRLYPVHAEMAAKFEAQRRSA